MAHVQMEFSPLYLSMTENLKMRGGQINGLQTVFTEVL